MRKYPDTPEGKEQQRLDRNRRQRERYASDPAYREIFKRASAKHKARNPSFQKQSSDRTFKCRFGITRLQRAEMLKEQGDKCALCGGADPRSSCGWHTDHDHETGTVRGVLCATCNVMLGAYETLKRGLSLEAVEQYLLNGRDPSRPRHARYRQDS